MLVSASLPGGVLGTIITAKQEEVARLQAETPLATLQKCAETIDPPRPFLRAIQTRIEHNQPAIIAEFKRASPSRSDLGLDRDAALVASSYQSGGATCLSVLTDQHFFKARPEDFQEIRRTCNLPMLRKDFMVHPWQIFQSRAMGADCILLILKALSDEQAKEMETIATDLGMAVLIECHDAEEIPRALMLESPLIGINNRNLVSLGVDSSFALGYGDSLIRQKRIPVAESGIVSMDTYQRYQSARFGSFLIGEWLMTAPNIGERLAELGCKPEGSTS